MPNNLTSNFRALTSSAAFFIACALAFMPAAASAEKADRDKPINIEADKLQHDELKQVSVFTGRAVLIKGTMVLRGERIEIRQDPDGYQFGVVSKAKRATQLQEAFKVQGVPALGVAGRFYTDGSLAGSMERAVQTMDFLIAEVRRGK